MGVGEHDGPRSQRVEDALLGELRIFRKIVEQAPDAIVVIGLDGKIEFANQPDPSFRAVRDGPMADSSDVSLMGEASSSPTALESASVIGRDAEEIAHPEDRPYVRSMIDGVIETGEAATFRARILGPDGVRWVRARIGPVLRDAKVERLAAIAIDITEQVESEQILRQSEERFRVLFDHAPEAQIILDVDAGRIVEANPLACTLFGRSREELCAAHPVSLSPQLQPDGTSSETRIREHARRVLGGEHMAFEWVFEGADGAPIPCDVRLVMLPHPKRRLIRGTYIDTRERKRQAAERESLSAELAQARKLQAVGQLTGGIAHDFNNLLMVLMNQLELIDLDAGDAEAVREHAVVATQTAERAVALTRRLLAFARRQPLRPRNVQINRLIVELEGLLRRTLGEAIEIETVLGGGLWLSEVDTTQLENAVLNLAINSRDAMPQGGKLTIETANARLDREYAHSHDEVAPGQYVMIAVTDSGVGIAPELLPRVFEPFFTTKESGRGTGLGLSMVYGFIKQSGGHVKVYSELGVGTTVRIYLPRASGKEAPRVPPSNEAEPRGNGELILVVEDDPHVRRTTETMLGRLGYTTICAGDGPSAIALLDERDIDLLLTDVVLAGPMNGAELVRQAKLAHPDLNVVFMSGYTQNAIIHNGRLDEGVTLLEKPFTRRDLAFALGDKLTSAKRS